MNHIVRDKDAHNEGDRPYEGLISPLQDATGAGQQETFSSLLRSTLNRLGKKQKSLGYAGGVIVVLVVWMVSGLLSPSANVVAPVPEQAAAGAVTSVAVSEFQAANVTRFISSPAEVNPERVLPLRVETAGRVQALPVSMGTYVGAGATIVQLEQGDRTARLESARAELAQRERDNEATEKLAESGFATKARVREVFAALQVARARVKEIEEEISNTSIKAPFGGVLDSLDVEVGEYLAVGTEVARVVDNNPLIVEAQVAQQNVNLLVPGLSANVSFVTGQERAGTIRYVSVQADKATHTFRVEIEVDNADGAIPSGTSAKVQVPVGDVPAHFVSPAIFSLDADGTLGVKSVDDQDVVRFHEVEIVRAESEGVWVTGLPERIRLITKGQGFVAAGDVVRPTLVADAVSSAAREL